MGPSTIRQCGLALLFLAACARAPLATPAQDAPREERDARVAAAWGWPAVPQVSLFVTGTVCAQVPARGLVENVLERMGQEWVEVDEHGGQALVLVVQTVPAGGVSPQNDSVKIQLRDAADVVVWTRTLSLPGVPLAAGSAAQDAAHQQQSTACQETFLEHVGARLEGLFHRDLPRMREQGAASPVLPNVGAWAQQKDAPRLLAEQAGVFQAAAMRVEGNVCGKPAGEVEESLRQTVDARGAAMDGTPSQLQLVVLAREDTHHVWLTSQLRTQDNLILFQDTRGVAFGRWFGSDEALNTARATCLKEAARQLAAVVQHVEGDVVASARTRLQQGPVARNGSTALVMRVAVLEFRSDAGVPQPALAHLADAARGGLADTLDARAFTVLTRESAGRILADLKRPEAQEGEDELATGRNLGAHLVMTGDVSKVDATLVATLKLFDAQTGALVGSRDADATTQLALLKAVRREAGVLGARVAPSSR